MFCYTNFSQSALKMVIIRYQNLKSFQKPGKSSEKIACQIDFFPLIMTWYDYLGNLLRLFEMRHFFFVIFCHLISSVVRGNLELQYLATFQTQRINAFGTTVHCSTVCAHSSVNPTAARQECFELLDASNQCRHPIAVKGNTFGHRWVLSIIQTLFTFLSLI